MKIKPLAAGPCFPFTRPRPQTQTPVFTPLPEAEHRLRVVFPEIWARYERLAIARGVLPSRADGAVAGHDARGPSRPPRAPR